MEKLKQKADEQSGVHEVCPVVDLWLEDYGVLMVV